MNNTAIFYRGVAKELEMVAATPGFFLKAIDDRLRIFHFSFMGQEGSALEGCVLHGRIVLPENYPYGPPTISFISVG